VSYLQSDLLTMRAYLLPATVGRPENVNRRSVRLARKTGSDVTMHPPSMLARLVAYSDSDNDTSLSDNIGADMSTEMPLGVASIKTFIVFAVINPCDIQASVTLPAISPPQAEGTTDGINSTGHNLIEVSVILTYLSHKVFDA